MMHGTTNIKYTVRENGGILSVTENGDYFYHLDLNGLYSSQGYESKFLFLKDMKVNFFTEISGCHSHISGIPLCISTITK